MQHATQRATTSQSPSPGLAAQALAELELLFRAIVYRSASPILIADDGRVCREASAGAALLFGRSRESLLGQKLDYLSEIWRAFPEQAARDGSLAFDGPDQRPRTVPFKARANVLPGRHALSIAVSEKGQIPGWVQDYALFLLDPNGVVTRWYEGAARIYGYTAAEAIGRDFLFLSGTEGAPAAASREDLKRAANAGYFGAEGSHLRKNGSRFRANSVIVAIRDGGGALQAFAVAVRDFTERRDTGETSRPGSQRPAPAQSTIAAVMSGEFDKVEEANDALLELTGYSREDLLAGRLLWTALTPSKYADLDERAHEECLRFGACTPYEKKMIRRDGALVPVLIATAVLRLSPLRWIAFVQDLRERDLAESVEQNDAPPEGDFGEIVGSSAALKRVERLIEVVAPTDATALILGETGTGKELVARAIHRMSPRRNMPFITLNCAAIPTGLLESELFGYERGAFTGALMQKIGRFEMANRGTLFLDEVGDIPLELQPKLLRALQEKSFERLGGTKTIPIDVRLVAATNRNLTQMMGDKLFRSDLYYRLKVFPITTPPLRDHPEDIPILARYFTGKYAAKMRKQIDRIPAETMRALVSCAWPGNVRELENFIERSVILSAGTSLRAPLAEIRPDANAPSGSTLEQVEREHILRVLRESDGVVTVAATKLGLHRTTLNAMMRKLGISRRDL